MRTRNTTEELRPQGCWSAVSAIRFIDTLIVIKAFTKYQAYSELICIIFQTYFFYSCYLANSIWKGPVSLGKDVDMNTLIQPTTLAMGLLRIDPLVKHITIDIFLSFDIS